MRERRFEVGYCWLRRVRETEIVDSAVVDRDAGGSIGGSADDGEDCDGENDDDDDDQKPQN